MRSLRSVAASAPFLPRRCDGSAHRSACEHRPQLLDRKQYSQLGDTLSLRLWQLVNISLLSLVTGVFWGTWLSLSRSITSFTPDVFLAIGHRMIANLGPVMAVLMPAAMLSTIPVMFLLYRQRSKMLYLTLLGFVLFVAALIVTLVVEVPIDNQIKAWTVSSVPADWQQLRDRWQMYHVIRTFASVLGFALIVGAAVFDPATPIRRAATAART